MNNDKEYYSFSSDTWFDVQFCNERVTDWNYWTDNKISFEQANRMIRELRKNIPENTYRLVRVKRTFEVIVES